MGLNAYRATVLQPDDGVETVQPQHRADGFRQINDAVIVVDEKGVITDFREIRDISTDPGSGPLRVYRGDVFFGNRLLRPAQRVILPPMVNTHDHAFQPPGIPGELIRFVDGGSPVGWLPDTLRMGEAVAKSDIERAGAMARSRMKQFANNGVGAVLEYTTSSLLAAQEVFNAGQDYELATFAGYVCMDQGIDSIQSDLQTSSANAVRDTAELLKTYGERVVVIDRFPIAVSSETRRKIAKLARKYDVLYETHADESGGEIDLHKRLYDGRSIMQVLDDDGVFGANARIGLAHAIHTEEREMDMIGDRIANRGCDVSIRACPSSNGTLGSHWRDGRYVRFPYQEWEKRGARITLGTDQGAGRNTNLFAEMLYERARHPAALQPDSTKLLRWGITNGYESLGIGPEDLRIEVGRKANFIVVQMAGENGDNDGYRGTFFRNNDHYGNIQMTAARVIEGGQHAENILASYVGGKRVKVELR